MKNLNKIKQLWTLLAVVGAFISGRYFCRLLIVYSEFLNENHLTQVATVAPKLELAEEQNPKNWAFKKESRINYIESEDYLIYIEPTGLGYVSKFTEDPVSSEFPGKPIGPEENSQGISSTTDTDTEKKDSSKSKVYKKVKKHVSNTLIAIAILYLLALIDD